MMRKRFGQIGGWALAVALMIPAAVSAQSPLVDRTDSFVPFAAPDSTLNATAVNHVQLASCCTSDGCATSPCQAPGCDSGCCDSGCCEPGCGAASCCAAGCCGCADGDLLDSLLGLLHPSESCYDYFLSPMTNPVFFEDPRTLTEARLIYLQHKVPLTAAGGDVNLVAMQLRAALTDRLSLIATKDGFITSTNPLIDDGWSDINVGLKYNLIRRPDLQFLYSVGATYEMPVGSTRTIQGNGDGTFHLFGTAGTRVDQWNWLLAHGVVLPADSAAESSWCYLSTHASRRLGGSNLFFVSEFNLYHWLESGAGGIPGIEGGDLFNLGSTDVEDNDIVTGAFGVKYKPSNRLEAGIAWENPLTKRRDVLENRLTVDLILRY